MFTDRTGKKGGIGIATGEKECERRERKAETRNYGSRPASMRRKENDRKKSKPNIAGTCRVSVRSDNSDPNNGAECGEWSFHCPIVLSDIKNSTDSQAPGGAKPSGEVPFRNSEGKRPRARESGRKVEVGGNNGGLPKMEGNSLGIKQGQTRQLSKKSHSKQSQESKLDSRGIEVQCVMSIAGAIFTRSS